MVVSADQEESGRLWLILSLILALAPTIAWAAEPGEEFTIAIFGDQQVATYCTNRSSAWLHLLDAVHWTATADEWNVKFAIQLGDITDHGGNRRGLDCECMASDPDPTCADVTTPGSPEGCEACRHPDAQACLGGIPGADCEWERARNAMNEFEKAGIPWVVVPGNHDLDAGSPVELSFFRRFFGLDRLTARALSVGGFVEGDPNVPSGISSYHVFEAAGTEWLHIGISYGASQAALDWAESVILANPGKPTIISTHNMISHLRWPQGDPEPALFACSNVGWCESGTGERIFDQLSRHPQVFLNLGGHAVGTWQDMVAHPESGHPVIGALIDYSWEFEGAPPWATFSNGGGGVVVLMQIDVKGGRIEVQTYSPRQDAWITTPEAQWGFDLSFCGSGRFDMEEVCAEVIPSMRRWDLAVLGALLILVLSLVIRKKTGMADCHESSSRRLWKCAPAQRSGE